MSDLEGFFYIQSGGVEGTTEGEGSRFGWLRRSHEQPKFFFRLQDNVLSYSKSQSDIALDIIIMQTVASASPDGTNDIVIKFKDTNRKNLVLGMDSPAERNKWLALLQSKTGSGSSTQSRKVSRRITVDFDDGASTAKSKKKLSLDIGTDVGPAKSIEKDAGTIVLQPSTSLADDDDDDDDKDDDMLKSCIDFSTTIQSKPKEKSQGGNSPEDIASPLTQQTQKSTNPFDDDDIVVPPSGLPEPIVVQTQGKSDEVIATVNIEPSSKDTKTDEDKKQTTAAAAAAPEGKKDEKKETDASILPDTIEDSMIGGGKDSFDIESSFISNDGRPFSAEESFVIPDEPEHVDDGKNVEANGSGGGDDDNSMEHSVMVPNVSESTYGRSVIMPKQTEEKPLLRQFRMMQEKAKRSKEDDKPEEKETVEKKEEEEKEPQKEPEAPVPEEKEPEWKLTKDSYVEVKDPSELRLLLKWGLPKGAAGIFADGIMIDLNPDQPPYWKLNEKGRIRIAMTKQEKLQRLRARILQAEKEGDKATVEALMQRHKDVAASEESEMTCFHFLDDLKLCYRQNEWVIMRELPPAEDDPNEWIKNISSRLTKFFTTAGKTIWEFLDFNEPVNTQPAPNAAAAAAPKSDDNASSSVPAENKPDPKEVLLQNLEKDVSNLIRVISAEKTEEEIVNLANDEKNPRVARLVRTFLCTDLACFAMDGFKKERLFGTYHIWDWISSYGNKNIVAATSITLLGIQKAISTVDALKYDKNASFRAFICVALNSQSLGTWLEFLVNEPERMNKFFTPEAMLRNEEVISSIQKQLARLSKVPFSLSLDFEARGMMSSKK